jgi:hypothetical protein
LCSTAARHKICKFKPKGFFKALERLILLQKEKRCEKGYIDIMARILNVSASAMAQGKALHK